MFFSPLNVTVTLRWDDKQLAAILKFLGNDDAAKALEITGGLHTSESSLKDAIAKTSPKP